MNNQQIKDEMYQEWLTKHNHLKGDILHYKRYKISQYKKYSLVFTIIASLLFILIASIAIT